MSVKIKICGITNADDAHLAVESGAEALGFVFFKDSPRCISPRQANAIIRSLPPFVAKVGLFVNADEALVRQTILECGLDTLQFHGEESPEYCARFRPLPVIKAFHIRSEDSLKLLPEYNTAAWLLDAYDPGQRGGTGQRFDWTLAEQAKTLGRPIILAGGLTPENVAAAIRQVRPYAVDVSSGVEKSPGHKDPRKLRDFIQAVRHLSGSASAP